MTRLHDLLDEYTEAGTTHRFEDWCRDAGFRYSRKGGFHLAHDESGRLVAAADVDPRTSEAARSWTWRHGHHPDEPHADRRPLPAKPCVTCHAAPVGTFHDGSPRYACGPHAPVWPVREPEA